jgi:hypothetical protein
LCTFKKYYTVLSKYYRPAGHTMFLNERSMGLFSVTLSDPLSCY